MIPCRCNIVLKNFWNETEKYIVFKKLTSWLSCRDLLILSLRLRSFIYHWLQTSLVTFMNFSKKKSSFFEVCNFWWRQSYRINNSFICHCNLWLHYSLKDFQAWRKSPEITQNNLKKNVIFFLSQVFHSCAIILCWFFSFCASSSLWVVIIFTNIPAHWRSYQPGSTEAACTNFVQRLTITIELCDSRDPLISRFWCVQILRHLIFAIFLKGCVKGHLNFAIWWWNFAILGENSLSMLEYELQGADEWRVWGMYEGSVAELK